MPYKCVLIYVIEAINMIAKLSQLRQQMIGVFNRIVITYANFQG